MGPVYISTRVLSYFTPKIDSRHVRFVNVSPSLSLSLAISISVSSSSAPLSLPLTLSICLFLSRVPQFLVIILK